MNATIISRCFEFHDSNENQFDMNNLKPVILIIMNCSLLSLVWC